MSLLFRSRCRLKSSPDSWLGSMAPSVLRGTGHLVAPMHRRAYLGDRTAPAVPQRVLRTWSLLPPAVARYHGCPRRSRSPALIFETDP
jgi:hypothetical protein